MSEIVLYGTRWCPDCWRARLFLRERKIPYRYVSVDEDPAAEDLVLRVNDGSRTVPTFEVDGRYFSCSPFHAEKLAGELQIPLNP